jgi:hypothetical protein
MCVLVETPNGKTEEIATLCAHANIQVSSFVYVKKRIVVVSVRNKLVLVDSNPYIKAKQTEPSPTIVVAKHFFAIQQ